MGDRVLVEATYNPNMPFKWNAQRIQTLPNQVVGLPSLSFTDCFWFKRLHSSFSFLLLEPDTGSTVTQDASGSSSAHCAADGVWCSGTASATVLAAGTDIGSFNHTSASDTASAIAAAATAKRCSFSMLSLFSSLLCLV